MNTDKSMKEKIFFKKKWTTVTLCNVPSLDRSGVGVGISRRPPAALKPQKLSKLSKSDLLSLTNPGEFLGPNTFPGFARKKEICECQFVPCFDFFGDKNLLHGTSCAPNTTVSNPAAPHSLVLARRRRCQLF